MVFHAIANATSSATLVFDKATIGHYEVFGMHVCVLSEDGTPLRMMAFNEQITRARAVDTLAEIQKWTHKGQLSLQHTAHPRADCFRTLAHDE